MSDILLNTDGDLSIVGGKVTLISDSLQALEQRLTIRLKTFQEEWFLNVNHGLPYYQQIFTKSIAQSSVDNLFRSYILETDGVVRLFDFSSTLNHQTRKYTLTFSVAAESGEVLQITNFEV